MKKIKNILLFLIFLFTINQLLLAQNKEADAIIGTWLMPDEEGLIEIFKDGEYYNGKIIWMKEKEEDGSPLKDKENPEDSLQSRTVEGLQVMKGFKYSGNNTWDGGTFYAARKGFTTEPDFELINQNQLNLCVSIFIFSKTIELTRVDAAKFLKEKTEN